MNRKYNRRRNTAGFTLVEILVVVGILAILASLVVQGVGGVRGEAEQTVAAATLQVVRDALCGTSTAPGLLCDLKHVPGFSNSALRVSYLLEAPTNVPAYDRLAQRGWRGPYVQNAQPVENTNAALWGRFPDENDRRNETDETFQMRGFYEESYGTTNDLAMADPWGNPIVLQIPTNHLDDSACLRYARLVSAGPDGVLQTPCEDWTPARTNRGDDLVLFLSRADVDE